MPHNEGKTAEEIAARFQEMTARSRQSKKQTLSESDIEDIKRVVLDTVSQSLDSHCGAS